MILKNGWQTLKVLMINSVCGIRSTGRICTDIAEECLSQGYEVKIAYGCGEVPEKYKDIAVKIGKTIDRILHGVSTRIFDNHAFCSKRATAEFLKWAEEYNPDILWLHNLHGYYINTEMLFNWIKQRPQMQVKWTLHDCWSFTGHCSYFIMAGCDKWKSVCHNCPQKRHYPASYLFDNSKSNFELKKKAFLGVKNMTLIVPSYWLADLVKQSFLKDYPIEVVHNRINTDIFKPTESDFRLKHGLENKKIILGAATAWGESKGLYDFFKLSKMLDKDYKVVLVGLTEKQMSKLPKEIVGIKRTNNTKKLAEIYTAADVFVNPSRQETFGLTTLEALSCGTKVIVYKNTACEEVAEKYGGIAVEYGNVEEIAENIKKICAEK